MAAASEHTILQFVALSATASVTIPSVLTTRIHPLVIFNICDCFVRRSDSAERVIGTLLGSILHDGTVDIRNSYAVPHNESSDQVAVDIDYHHNMLASHLKVNPKEIIVGWYSTGVGVNGVSALIHVHTTHSRRLYLVGFSLCAFWMAKEVADVNIFMLTWKINHQTSS